MEFMLNGSEPVPETRRVTFHTTWLLETNLPDPLDDLERPDLCSEPCLGTSVGRKETAELGPA